MSMVHQRVQYLRRSKKTEIPHPVDFKKLFYLLKTWFDWPTPAFADFDHWRHSTYHALEDGSVQNLPLKTWWPKYTEGDFRLELSIGALLIQQVSWPAVKTCIQNISDCVERNGRAFELDGVLGIPEIELENLVRPSRFWKQKSQRIRKFCRFVKKDSESMEDFFQRHSPDELDRILKGLKAGFGNETRDCILLYATNHPVFIADAYARRLLTLLGVTQSKEYSVCQRAIHGGIRRSFSDADLERVAEEYTQEERRYALCNGPQHQQTSRVLLYQQFHAGIDELGISGRWDEFVQAFKR